MMHPGWVCLWAALASTASAGGAALLYALAHESLSAAADPLPFLVLALGVLGWLLQAPPAGQATAQRRRKVACNRLSLILCVACPCIACASVKRVRPGIRVDFTALPPFTQHYGGLAGVAGKRGI